MPNIGGDVFVSEDEAFEIISAELKKAGFTIIKGGDKIKNAEVPVTNPYSLSSDSQENETLEKESMTIDEFNFDAQLVINSDNKINIAFFGGEPLLCKDLITGIACFMPP